MTGSASSGRRPGDGRSAPWGPLAVMIGVAIWALSACVPGEREPTAPDPAGRSLRGRAGEFAASADRALLGTGFEGVGAARLGQALEALCTGTGPLRAAAQAEVRELSPAAERSEDDLLVEEVLLVGVEQVCPERATVDLVDGYLGSVLFALESAGLEIDPLEILSAGPVACEALDQGRGAERALLDTVDALFGVTADSLARLAASGFDAEGAVVAGTVLAAAVEHLCPAHRVEVVEFIETLR